MRNKVITEEWLNQRRTGIGSTDVAPIMGLSKRRTALHIQQEKLEGLVIEGTSELMEIGLAMEPVILALYARKYDRNPRRVHRIIRSKEFPFMIASLDATAAPRIDVECKFVEYPDKDEWGEEGSDEIPVAHVLQTQHQLAVTGFEVAEVPVLMRGKLRRYIVRRNEPLIEQLIERERYFWEKHIIAGEPVAPDPDNPATLELIRRIYAVDDAKHINLGPDMIEVVSCFQEAKNERSQQDKIIERMQTEILCAMGDAGAASLPDGTMLIRTKIHRKAYSVQETEYVQLKVKQLVKEEA